MLRGLLWAPVVEGTSIVTKKGACAIAIMTDI